MIFRLLNILHIYFVVSTVPRNIHAHDVESILRPQFLVQFVPFI